MNIELINQISNLNIEVINLNHLIISFRDDNNLLIAPNIELEANCNLSGLDGKIQTRQVVKW